MNCQYCHRQFAHKTNLIKHIKSCLYTKSPIIVKKQLTEEFINKKLRLQLNQVESQLKKEIEQHNSKLEDLQKQIDLIREQLEKDLEIN